MSRNKTDHSSDETSTEDDAVAKLIHLAGARTDPSELELASIKRVALGRWERLVTKRRHRQRMRLFQIAATVLFFLAIGAWQLDLFAPGSVVAGTVELADGRLRMLDGTESTNLLAGDIVRTQTDLSTGPDGPTALRLTNGVGIRLDRGSRVRLLDADHIRLKEGRLYVDTSAADDEADIAIETRHGEVRHLGTRFAVVDIGDSVHVQVREGRVEVSRRSETWQADAGTELVLLADGSADRQPIPSHGEVWAWVLEASPGFSLEGATLGEFLDWVAAETGWTIELEVADPQVRRTDRLHGSLEGLNLENSLDVVLRGSGLTYQVEAGRLMIRDLQP